MKGPAMGHRPAQPAAHLFTTIAGFLAVVAVAMSALVIGAAPAIAAPGVHPGGDWLDLVTRKGHSDTSDRGDNGLRCWSKNSQGPLGLGVMGDIGDAIGEMGDFLPPVSLTGGIIFDPAGIETVVPFRVLETRAGEPTSDGLQEGIGRRTPGQVTTVDVAGRAGVDVDAEAAITLTAISPGANGHATAYP